MKKFETPEMKIVDFAVEDVIATSEELTQNDLDWN